MVGLLLAVTLHAIAELAIAVALPRISGELDGSSLYGAAISAYLLASIISLVWSGHIVDSRGPLFPFVTGLSVFALGNTLASLASNLEVLVFARFVQGLGGGAFSTVVYAAVNKTWNDLERPKILALLSAAWVLPGLVAPLAAGAIVQYWSWRWIFIVLCRPSPGGKLLMAGRHAMRTPATTRRRDQMSKGLEIPASAIVAPAAINMACVILCRPLASTVPGCN